MDTLKKNLLLVKSNQHPNAFIVDDAKVKINGWRYI
jgi:hypothetical protein